MKEKITKTLYTHFLVASEGNVTATRLEEVQEEPGLHDRVTRWLAKSKLTPGQLWELVKEFVNKKNGWFILDDSVLDKPFGLEIGLSYWQYSGTYHKVMNGIGLVTLLWTDGTVVIPVNYRIYAKQVDGKTKHDHAREMLIWAHGQGFMPEMVLMDSWYGSVKTLKLILRLGWQFMTELRGNRLTEDKPGHFVSIEALDLSKTREVYLKGVGLIRVAKTDDHQNGRVRYLCCSRQDIEDVREAYARRWVIEVYHRELKQTIHVTKCQARRARSQRNHIFCSLLAFCALQIHKTKTGLNAYQVKRKLFNPLIQSYLAQPLVSLTFTH